MDQVSVDSEENEVTNMNLHFREVLAKLLRRDGFCLTVAVVSIL
jgi:hypothetical protein